MIGNHTLRHLLYPVIIYVTDEIINILSSS